MAFKFTSSGDALVESFWDLVIPGNDISVAFMLVAHVTEPDVVVDQSHINFGTVLLGKNTQLSVQSVTKLRLFILDLLLDATFRSLNE